MDCLAHRGFAAVAPENTVAALKRARGATMVEFDLRRCGSGELVVIHDETVDRVTDGSGPVADHSLDDLAALDVLGSGEGVPSLATVLAVVPEETGVNVELKEQGLARDLAAELAASDHDVLVSSFDDGALAAYAAVADHPLAYVFAKEPESGLERALELDAAAVHPQWDLCDPAFVERAHDHGLTVNCWTIRGQRARERARQAGVDGVISDDPQFCSP